MDTVLQVIKLVEANQDKISQIFSPQQLYPDVSGYKGKYLLYHSIIVSDVEKVTELCKKFTTDTEKKEILDFMLQHNKPELIKYLYA